MKPPSQHMSVTASVIVVMLSIAWIHQLWLDRNTLPEGLVQANGRIEGDHITVASKIPGRIASLMVREGDTVTAGQIVVRLEDGQVRARVDSAERLVMAMEAEVGAARHALEVLQSEVPLAVEAAEAGLASARATVAKTAAGEQRADRESIKLRELASRGSVDDQRAEQAKLALSEANTEYSAVQYVFTQAEKQLANARLGWERIEAKKDEVSAIEAKLQQTRAALAEAQSVFNDLIIKAPQSGVVMTRVRDTGEVVAAGAPLLDLLDLDRLYLKVYIPEADLGKLRLGLLARIYTDAYPDDPVPATLRYIASRAEFTPTEVQTPEERVKLVYAVKLDLDSNAERRFNPGQPANVVIRWRDDVAWVKPRW